MYKKASPSRLSYVFTIIVWNIILASSIIFFDQLENMGNWTPTSLHRIDTMEIIFLNIFIAALIWSLVSWIFREIRHSSVIENILVRRFLPIIRFFITASIWIVVLFHILEKLGIDTRSILTWAWIWWAILAFAAKDVMTNFLWSISILLGRIYDIWEEIRIRKWFSITHEGVVEEITLNYTKITRRTGEVVYIPNRTIYAEIIENISRQRYVVYTYIIPFSKEKSVWKDIKERLKIIEWKISEYNPLFIEWRDENTNAWDYTYIIEVQFPEENADIDSEIRQYLAEHIFRG